MNKEIEIKLKIDEDTFNKFVKDTSSFQFEKTYGFFTDGYKNMEKGIFPRIKEVIDGHDRKAYVTVKVKNEKDEVISSMFIRDEYEFVVNVVDGKTIDSIRGMFFALEYTIEHIFEKRRFRLEPINECDFVVDELPFGYFIEIEGDEENIEKSIKELGLENNERINSAYLKLWDVYKKENNLTGECIFK